METKILSAIIYENSISLELQDKYENVLFMRVPCATRSDRADMEDRLLTAGVNVLHTPNA